MYGVVLKANTGLDAKIVMERLLDYGFQTRPFFYPMHKQPAFEKFNWFRNETLPVSEEICKYGFYLPSGLTVTKEQIESVTKKVSNILTLSRSSYG
jgi:perosamine synthetase